MKLFDLDTKDAPVTFSKEGEEINKSIWKSEPAQTYRVVDTHAHGRTVQRPAPTDNLFPIVEPTTRVYSMGPLERQRHADGSPITMGNVTSLRPPEPELYLSKAFANPDVPSESNTLNMDHKYDAKKYEPNKVVKAFLEG